MNSTIKGHRMSDEESFNMLMNEIEKAFFSTSKKELDVIFDMTFNDISVKMTTNHLGTFVKAKEDTNENNNSIGAGR